MDQYPGKAQLEIDASYYNSLDIHSFSLMMKDPSYCYKFYWLEAIVQLIAAGVSETTFDEIIDEMICNAWYSVREFHIHLSGLNELPDDNDKRHGAYQENQDIDPSQEEVGIKRHLQLITCYHKRRTFVDGQEEHHRGDNSQTHQHPKDDAGNFLIVFHNSRVLKC